MPAAKYDVQHDRMRMGAVPWGKVKNDGLQIGIDKKMGSMDMVQWTSKARTWAAPVHNLKLKPKPKMMAVFGFIDQLVFNVLFIFKCTRNNSK